jgi:hypothetical protein
MKGCLFYQYPPGFIKTGHNEMGLPRSFVQQPRSALVDNATAKARACAKARANTTSEDQQQIGDAQP